MEPDAVEIRVIGCLVEKQRTTPDVYPLTLNALRLACNQSTNRDPVVDYDDSAIRGGLDRLVARKWATLASWSNRRAMKYRHTLDRALDLDAGELAIACVLMLRGPQTPGELRARTERLHHFGAAEELQSTLDRLIDREMVRRLERRPGQREERYEQLLGGVAQASVDVAVPDPVALQPPPAAPPPAAAPPAAPLARDAEADGLAGRVERLERELAELRDSVSELRRELGA
jgi:uncharacterized protein YceH (UPF0502 family)